MEVEFKQNTEEWRNWRSKKLGASDAPAVMGKSEWTTAYQLWEEKTGLKPRVQKSNYAIERGHRFEPVARSLYELEVGIDMPPTNLVHPRYDFLTASMDGYNHELKIGLEIKIAGREVFEAAKAGVVHEKYYYQVLQQMEVSGADEIHFFVCKAEKKLNEEFITDAALVVVKRTPEVLEDIKNLLVHLLGFWRMVQDKIPPPLCERDVMEADDQVTVMLFARLRKAKHRVDELLGAQEVVAEALKLAKAEYEEMKEEAIEHAQTVLGHTRIASVGVNLSKNKNGSWKVIIDSCNEGVRV